MRFFRHIQQHLTRDLFTPHPWVNGKGITHEIAVAGGSTIAAGGAPFVWRLSMAELQPPGGAFSEIASVDRALTLLEGEMALSIDGGEMENLALHVPVMFPGDVLTESAVRKLGRDLNLMWDRTRAVGRVTTVSAGSDSHLEGARGGGGVTTEVGSRGWVESLTTTTLDVAALRDRVAFVVALGNEGASLRVGSRAWVDGGESEDESEGSNSSSSSSLSRGDAVVLAEDDAARIELVDERGGGGGDDDDGCVWLRVERGEVALCEIFAQR